MSDYTVGASTAFGSPCFCVGGPDCCIVRGRRDRDEALREEGRRQERDRADGAYTCQRCGHRYRRVKQTVTYSCTVLHSPGSCCHYNELPL